MGSGRQASRQVGQERNFGQQTPQRVWPFLHITFGLRSTLAVEAAR
jgi:hypothetical protein